MLQAWKKLWLPNFGLHLPVVQWLEQEKQLDQDGLRERIIDAAQQQYQAKVDQVSARGDARL